MGGKWHLQDASQTWLLRLSCVAGRRRTRFPRLPHTPGDVFDGCTSPRWARRWPASA